MAYRKAMLKVFTATSSTVPQRVLLATLPNGNWANHDAVEWYMPLGTPRERVDGSRVSAMLEAGLCYCLIGSKPHLWQRHRWLGSEIAVEELGKLQMVHGLLVPVYTRFLERFSSTRMVPNVGACAVGSGPLPIEAGADDIEPTDHDAGQAEQWTANASSSQGAFLDSLGDERAFSSKQHARDRKIAREWMQENVLLQLLVFRLTMEPLRGLVLRQLQMSSHSWEVSQRARVLARLSSPDSIPGGEQGLPCHNCSRRRARVDVL